MGVFGGGGGVELVKVGVKVRGVGGWGAKLLCLSVCGCVCGMCMGSCVCVVWCEWLGCEYFQAACACVRVCVVWCGVGVVWWGVSE